MPSNGRLTSPLPVTRTPCWKAGAALTAGTSAPPCAPRGDAAWGCASSRSGMRMSSRSSGPMRYPPSSGVPVRAAAIASSRARSAALVRSPRPARSGDGGGSTPRRTLQPSAHARANESSTAARRPPCFLCANPSTTDSYDGERGGQPGNGLHITCPFGFTQQARRIVIDGRCLFAGQTFESMRSVDLLCGQLASRA